MQIFIFIAYFILGLFQLAAIIAGLDEWLGLHWLIAAPLSLFVAYIPIVGTVLGMFGAITAWKWSWLLAGGLFLGPLAFILIMAIVLKALEKH